MAQIDHSENPGKWYALLLQQPVVTAAAEVVAKKSKAQSG